ncbi:MAG: biotin/lipoyl-binding protein [Chloracidobacterium sp.]|nr:biotin/lipoyl-binding protein [Chloracidobacterium sp.]
MKLRAEIGDEKLEVELHRDGDTLVAAIDGREYRLEVSEPEPGVLLFKNEGKITEALVSARNGLGDPTEVTIRGRTHEVKLIDPKRLRGSAGGADQGDGAAEIRTAMPGKVVRIVVGPGSEVAKGDGVIVVEAMKMQNELKSPKAGVVKEVRVAEGATVTAGDVLAVIE